MGIDWRMGAEWFETCLLDYDPCSNYGNWTYGSGKCLENSIFDTFYSLFPYFFLLIETCVDFSNENHNPYSLLLIVLPVQELGMIPGKTVISAYRNK